MKRIIILVIAAVFLNCLFLPALVAAQTKDSAEISNLINKLANENEGISRDAAGALIKIGPNVIAPLIESVKLKKFCDFQFAAAQVIREIDKKQEKVKSILFEVASGQCDYRYSPEKYLPDANFSSVISQWFAAAVLASEIEGGITLVTELLKEEKGIYSAVFAFGHLAEMIKNSKQEKTEIKPEIISGIKATIPLLVKSLDTKHDKLRCDFYAIIQVLQESNFEELRNEANRAMQGKTVNCS